MGKFIRYFIFILIIISCSSLTSQKWSKSINILKIREKNWELVKRIINNPDSLESIINNSKIVSNSLKEEISKDCADKYKNYINNFFQGEIILDAERFYCLKFRMLSEPLHSIILKNEKADRLIIFVFRKNDKKWKLKSIMDDYRDSDTFLLFIKGNKLI